MACEFLDHFPEELPGLPPHKEIEFCINVVSDTAPIYMPPCRMASVKLRELKEQLQELLDKSFIRPSTSPWGAPILLWRERMVHFDCTSITENWTRSVKNKYSLPRIDDLFDKFQGAQYLSKIDLRSSYHQLWISKVDVSKTAFRARDDQYEWIPGDVNRID